MKKYLAFIIAVALLLPLACKKSEEKKESTPAVQEKAAPATRAGRERPARAPRAAEAVPLEFFEEATLIASLSAEEYDALPRTKIKIGKNQREVEGVLLNDLLKKYNLTGKNVVVSGPNKSVPMTWEQATTGQVHILRSPKNQYQIVNPGRELNIKFPAQIVKIQVTEKAEAASTDNPKPAKKAAK